MKKHLCILGILVFSMFSIPKEAQAQGEVRGFNKGKVVAQLGIGLGTHGYSSRYVSRGFAIPLVAGVEVGVHDYVGIGGYFGYATRRYNRGYYTRYGTRYDRYRINTISTGVRGTFHFYNMIEDLTGGNLFTDKLDIYVGILTGYERNIYSDKRIKNDSGRFFGGGMVGARYYFSPAFGVYAEFGYNVLSVVNLGFAVRFGRKN